MTGMILNFDGRARIRPIRQTETTECGIACLAMVLNYHGLDIDLGSLRRMHPVSLKGISLRTLIAMANRMSLVPRPVKCALGTLSQLPLPAILHWDMTHFVVLEAIDGHKHLIHDPARGTRRLSAEEVSRHFTGVALELRPAPEFRPAHRRQTLHLSQLWSRIHGLKRTVAQVLLLTLVLQAFFLASPYLLQVAVDTVLPSLDLDFLAVLALGFGGFVLIHVAASLLRGFVLLRLGSALSFQIAANLARRLLRLPISFFERRHIGDVLSRFSSIEPVQRVLTTGAVAALVDGMLVVLTLGLMFVYSPLLAAIALIAFALYVLVRLATYRIERQRDEDAIIARAKQESLMIETLRGIVTLRIFGREDERHILWQNRTADAVNAEISSHRLRLFQENANLLIFGLENVLSIYLAISLAIDGGFTAGMVFAFMAYKQQFVTKAASFIDQAMELHLLGLHTERMADIALQPEDRGFAPRPATTRQIAGAIDLSGVAYRYTPSDPAVLNGVDLKVAAGEHIAITGPSGGGKSTLLKVMLGLVEPQEGRIQIDGEPLDMLGQRTYRQSVAAVLQDDQLFAGSIADNIAFFDAETDPAFIEQCARLAAIHDEIMAMPMRYETLVGDMGAALSGGQKQRVLLARALYRRPKILFMDEGTAHLDAATEAAVSAAVAGLGITRIVIAHRWETIRYAQRIYKLEAGRLLPLTVVPSGEQAAATATAAL